MSMNYKQNVIQYVIDIITSCGEKIIELEKGDKKLPGKDKWKTLNVIKLMPLVGVNNRQLILHIFKIIIHCYYTDESINQHAINYIINP